MSDNYKSSLLESRDAAVVARFENVLAIRLTELNINYTSYRWDLVSVPTLRIYDGSDVVYFFTGNPVRLLLGQLSEEDRKVYKSKMGIRFADEVK